MNEIWSPYSDICNKGLSKKRPATVGICLKRPLFLYLKDDARFLIWCERINLEETLGSMNFS